MQNSTTYKPSETEQIFSDKEKLKFISSAINSLLGSIEGGMKINIKLIKLDITYSSNGSNTDSIKIDFA